jgi:Na+-translocating ferredoxin:NAD+ oxidoreductase subunit G
MELIASIRRNSLGLGLFAIVTAGMIALTHYLTQATIQDNIIRAQLAAFNEILSPDRYDNDLYTDTLQLPADTRLGSKAPTTAYVARKNGQVEAIIFETIAPGGYNGELRLIVAIDKNAVVTGTRVISHKETPGLGDKVDLKKSNWILSFNQRQLGQSADKDWQVKKDGGQFDQFTGATITPRAVIRAVKDTLIYFQEHQTTLLRG